MSQFAKLDKNYKKCTDVTHNKNDYDQRKQSLFSKKDLQDPSKRYQALLEQQQSSLNQLQMNIICELTENH